MLHVTARGDGEEGY